MYSVDSIKGSYGTEVALMILVCRVFAETASKDELQSFIDNEMPDWAVFSDIVRYHRIRPVVFKVLSSINVPTEILNGLKADCTRIAFRNLHLLQETFRLYSLLEDKEITIMPYKGALFCIEYYKEMGLREFDDIDFLVAPDVEHFDKIKKELEVIGYTDMFNIPPSFQEMNFKHSCQTHFDFYENNYRKYHVELQWLILHPDFDSGNPITNEVLINDAKEKVLFDKKVRVLSATSHLCAIMNHHGLQERWRSMKYFIDLTMLLKDPDIDWEKALIYSKAYKFNKALNGGLAMLNDILGISSPISINKPDIEGLKKEFFSLHTSKFYGTFFDLRQKLKMKDNLGGKIRMLYEYLIYPFRPNLDDYKFLELPTKFFFLYPFIKPVRIVKERIQGLRQVKDSTVLKESEGY